MRNSNWYVITGAPGAGKTTTVELLKQQGYTTTHETARIYFESQMQQGIKNEEIRANPQKLQHAILEMQIALESQYPHDQLLFLDRALPDSFGYFAYHKLTQTPQLLESKHDHYRKVFFLEALPMRKDAVRIESDREAEVIAQYTLDAYKNLGHEVIIVPVMGKKERVDFILHHVDSAAA